jgi:hypothetical protein
LVETPPPPPSLALAYRGTHALELAVLPHRRLELGQPVGEFAADPV